MRVPCPQQWPPVGGGVSAARRAWSWQLVLPRSVATVWGRRERVRRGGYPSRTAAAAARDELLGRSPEECTTQAWTVGRWLRYWLATRTSIRPSTLRAYTEHVERHLLPTWAGSGWASCAAGR